MTDGGYFATAPVSGDKHLKNIGKFKEIGIVNAREFWDILKL